MTITNAETVRFIEAHRNDDIRQLALSGTGRDGVDMPFALDQIAGWQTARRKLPTWASTDGIIYPPHLSMEQCSSEATALYKAALAERLVYGNRKHAAEDGNNDGKEDGGTMFADITGGFGVDFSYIARRFGRAVYIERQPRLCDIARENFRTLGLNMAEVVCGDCEEWLQHNDNTHADLIMADPARRDTHGGRTFAISDCTPDVLAMKDVLLDMADHVIIKLSPMLDWHKAAEDFGPEMCEIHIVSTGNECKELLLVASRNEVDKGDNGRGKSDDDGCLTPRPRIFCVNDGTVVEVTEDADTDSTHAAGGPDTQALPEPIGDLIASSPLFLYEPNASIMKAGCFKTIERHYGVRQIDTSSHLFLSDRPVDNFPGRKFSVTGVCTMNKKELKKALAGIDKANITTRNFPMTVAELRRKLKIKEGGETYIFATTLPGKSHVLMICSK